MQHRFADQPEVASRMVSLQLGLEMEHAALKFWTALREEADTADAPAEYCTDSYADWPPTGLVSSNP